MFLEGISSLWRQGQPADDKEWRPLPRPAHRAGPSAPPRTVIEYDLCAPSQMGSHLTVHDAATRMRQTDGDFVLLVDDAGHLQGIITDRDIVFRVLALGRDPHTTPISAVMTAAPQVVPSAAHMIEALSIMVNGRFRHLPVMQGGAILGVLDISQCLYEALQKLELADATANEAFFSSSRSSPQRPSADEPDRQGGVGGVGGEDLEEERGHEEKEAQDLVESLRDLLSTPQLSAVCSINPNRLDSIRGEACTVADAICAMQEVGLYAIAVVSFAKASAAPLSGGDRLVGILTCRDIVLRVILASRSVESTTIGEVMTRSPRVARSDASLVEALRTMYSGGFLHLPVVHSDGDAASVEEAACPVIGVVDALQLTHLMLDKLNGPPSLARSGTPLWHYLWPECKHDALISDDRAAAAPKKQAGSCVGGSASVERISIRPVKAAEGALTKDGGDAGEIPAFSIVDLVPDDDGSVEGRPARSSSIRLEQHPLNVVVTFGVREGRPSYELYLDDVSNMVPYDVLHLLLSRRFTAPHSGRLYCCGEGGTRRRLCERQEERRDAILDEGDLDRAIQSVVGRGEHTMRLHFAPPPLLERLRGLVGDSIAVKASAMHLLLGEASSAGRGCIASLCRRLSLTL